MQAWARQHQQRLATALTELRSTQELLENLLTWLQWAESNLDDKDREALPQEIDEVKGLIAEHQASRAAFSQTFWTNDYLALCLQSSAKTNVLSQTISISALCDITKRSKK